MFKANDPWLSHYPKPQHPAATDKQEARLWLCVITSAQS